MNNLITDKPGGMDNQINVSKLFSSGSYDSIYILWIADVRRHVKDASCFLLHFAKKVLLANMPIAGVLAQFRRPYKR
jgi:hypothetical protein